MTTAGPNRITMAVRALPPPLRDATHRLAGLVRGEWPTALADVVQPLLNRNPVTFNEKVRYRLARDRRPILATFADKLLARDYAAERIDAGLLLPLLATGRSGADIPWADLPREYACKVNHASGGVVIVSDCADPGLELPRNVDRVEWRRYLVHPDRTDPGRMRALVDHWLAMPYRRNAGAYPEWAYRGIDRRVLVEEYWPGEPGLPRQLCLLCNDGEPRAFFAGVQDPDVRPAGTRFFLADEEPSVAAWSGLDDREWDRMMVASRALSAGVDMVRVDWLVGSGGVRFSELTNYPAGGRGNYAGHDRLSAEEYEAAIAAHWRLP